MANFDPTGYLSMAGFEAAKTASTIVAVPVRGAGRIYKRIQSGAGKQDAFCDPCIKV